MKGIGRPVALVCAAAAIALVAFIYRFNTLGGALGGFDNDHFIYLIRSDVVLAGEQPLRDFVDAELRGAWPALTYEVSAWAQRLGGRTLLPEAFLSAGALAAAGAIVFVAALDLSKRWLVGLLAAAVTIAMTPKLYNYPKVLMLALAAWALAGVVATPTRLRLGVLALITAAAALFRHDLGLYIAAATGVALLARDPRQSGTAARTLGTYVAMTAVLLLPSAIWVQVYEGIPAYIRGSLASVSVEQARTELFLPPLDWAAPFAGESLLLVTYFAFWAVPIVAGFVLLMRVWPQGAARLSPAQRGAGAGLLVMAVLANMSFLRANLAERFGDAAAPVVLLAAWTIGAGWGTASPAVRAAAAVVPILLMGQLASAYSFSDTRRELDTSGLSESWEKVSRRYGAVREELGELPPSTWERPAAGDDVLSAARYVAACTNAGDRLLVTGATHEIPVLARRRFAAGQAMFKLSLYTSERDQRRALERLAQQQVPVVLADARDFDEGFVSDYPLVAAYLAERYEEAGTLSVDDEPRLRVFVDTHRQPRGRDAQSGLPCFR